MDDNAKKHCNSCVVSIYSSPLFLEHDAKIHGRRNILVQLAGELLSEEIDEALRVSEGYEGVWKLLTIWNRF